MLVGNVTVDRERLAAVVGVVEAVKTCAGGVVGIVVCSGTVVAVLALAVVTGDSLASGAVVVVTEDDREPDALDPEDDEPDEAELDPDDDEANEVAVETVRLPSSVIFSGGVSSRGLALAMNRLKIWAGRDPPLTRATPRMLYSSFDCPSGYPIQTAVVRWRV